MKHSQEEKWVYSLNDDVFTTGEYFDTKEQAIEGAKADLTWEGECPAFYVGQVKSADFAFSIDTDVILETISQNVYEEFGEVAEDYLNDVQKEHYEVLEEELWDVINKWMDKFGYNPDFFKVVNIEKMSI